MTSRSTTKNDVGASVPPLGEDDLFELHGRVSGAFAYLLGAQRLMEVEPLEGPALEPAIAVLMPARDRLDELVKAAKSGKA